MSLSTDPNSESSNTRSALPEWASLFEELDFDWDWAHCAKEFPHHFHIPY